MKTNGINKLNGTREYTAKELRDIKDRMNRETAEAMRKAGARRLAEAAEDRDEIMRLFGE